MKLFSILAILSIVLVSCTEPVGDAGDEAEYWWRAKKINGCTYIVPVYGHTAITHAGNCDNHDTTRKDTQEKEKPTNGTK
jgi:hypothetical protein